jgi:hypothetical protein
MSTETARKASLILLRFVTDREAKLRYGARIRAMMHEAIERGEEPKHYRVKWIVNTTGELFQWLANKAAEFNAAHPQDAISTDDLSDLLATAQSKLTNHR